MSLEQNEKPLRVRIVNDGGPAYATKITNAETGELIDGVTNIEISIGVNKDPIKAKITITRPMIDIVADAEVEVNNLDTRRFSRGSQE